MRNTIIITGTLIAAGAFASEELLIGETTPIGEVSGVTYLATPREPGPAGTSFEIQTSAGNVYETIAELTVPASDTYYAGVSPDGKYFYIAGEADTSTSETDPENYLNIYEFDKVEPVLEYTSDNYKICGTSSGTRYSWEGGKLYFVVSSSTGGLGAVSYEADPQTGEVNARLPERSISLSTGDKPGEPLSEYVFQMMEYLRSIGYPVYDKNTTFCSGVTVPFGPEYIILGTGDEKDEVVDFYVAADGTPYYYESGTEIYRVWEWPPDVETHDEDDGLSYEEEEVVLFRDWEMPVGVRASRDGDGTEIIYDVLGDVFAVETE